MALDIKQFPSKVVEMQRSQLYLCDYNPRKISEEGRKALKRSLKKFGVLGGIIVNLRNDPAFGSQPKNMVCSGNQKVALLDAANKYPDRDYTLRVEAVDYDPKTEKEVVVAMNNANIGGDWDFDLLRELLPDIDYKDVGFTEADLSMIGVDFSLQSPGEIGTASALDELMAPEREAHAQELELRRAQREAERLAEERDIVYDGQAPEWGAEEGLTREERVQAMKDLKAQVKEKAVEKASNMLAYFTVSFDTWQAKARFLEDWGYDPQSMHVKGEDFAKRVEGYDTDDGNDYE